MAYEGYIESATDTEIRGWVFDNAAPNEVLTVEILADDRVLTTVQADQFRPDLLAAGKGNGVHSFHYTIDPAAPSVMAARIAGRRWLLQSVDRPPFPLRTVAHLSHTLEYGLPVADQAFSTAAPADGEGPIIDRLMQAYHRTISDDPQRQAKNDIWSALADFCHREILDLLQHHDSKGLANYMREVHAKGLTHGISQGEVTTQRFRADADARKIAIAQFLDYLVSLGESLGLLNVECPEQRGQWGQNLHVDPQELIDRISVQVGFPIVPPQAAGSLLGIQTRDGVICARDMMALYAALRLQTISGELGLKSCSICEIGGGLGGVAYYSTRLALGRHTIIDLPLVSLLQGYILLRSLPNDHVRLYGEDAKEHSRVELMPTWYFHQEEKKYDLLFNQDSMPEMHHDYVVGYLRRAKTNVHHAFLSVNQESQAAQSEAARQGVVGEVIRAVGGYKRSYRFRHWLRPGYIEELFRISAP
jgi:hypothetical protein